jgi:DUF4097 and DUF4098 domain-containing protein YvlB
MTVRHALAMSTIAASTVALSACVALADKPRHEKSLDVTIAHVDAESLKVEGRNGSITIAPHDGDQVAISAKLYGSDRARVDQTVVRAEREKDGTLRVWAEWPTEPKGNEGVTFSILIPSTAGIDADTSNGAITVTGLSGPYILDTSNGPIELVGAAGDVRADTSNGSITINGAPNKVLADTSNGNIRIDGATGPVTTDSSNGNIELMLADTNPGPVVADTSNGSIELAVGPAFGGAIIADTSNGKVRFGPFPEGFSAAVTDAEKDTLRATFGTATHKSRLDTSNGGIVIRATKGG